MGVLRPEDMNAAFARALNSGDIEQLVSLYEPDAILAPMPGQRAVGLDAIRAALEGLLGVNGQMEAKNNYCMRAGDIAMLQGEWVLRLTGPDGEPAEQRSRTAEVVRRQTDGTWLYVIDHPFVNDD
jgi:uncharacterized protein (TIGR02246 family)